MSANVRLVRYFAGASASRLAEEVSIPALLLFGLAISGSTQQAALLYSAITVSAAVGGPVLGSVLDRAARPHVILGACVAIYAGALGLIVVAGQLSTLPVALAIAVGAGVFAPTVSGGWSSQLGAVADAHRLRRSQSLDAATFNIAGLLGPVVASAIALIVSPAVALVAAAGLAVVGAIIAFSVGLHRDDRTGGTRPVRIRVLVSDVVNGLGVILGHRRLRAVTLASTVSYLGFGAFVVSVPALAAQSTGTSETAGFFFSVLAAASLVVVLAAARWPTPWSYVIEFLIATAVISVGMAVAAATGVWWMGLIGMALVGLGDGPQLAAVFAARTADAPERARAMVFLTAASMKISAAAIGGLIGGALATSGHGPSMWFGAAVQVVAVLLCAGLLRRPAATSAPR